MTPTGKAEIPGRTRTGSSARRDILRLEGPLRAAVLLQPAEEMPDAARGESHPGVGGAVVHVQGVAVVADRAATGKRHVSDVTVLLVGRLGAEDPLVAAQEADIRVLEVEKRQSQPVKRPRGCMPDAMVEHEPPRGRLNERRR